VSLTTVWDASVLLMLLQRERGWEALEEALEHVCISTVNIAEVLSRLIDRGADAGTVTALLASLPIRILPFTASQAIEAAKLRASTRVAGLSLGDRACLALASELGAPAATADQVWAELGLPVPVRLVR
jgi:ribonuclease VapC